MIKDKKTEEDYSKWKRINMRSVEHLMGVEFIHDLYNRHEPKINSIRFRHTRTVWKNGVVNSYAPEDEWEDLERILGYQYHCLDPMLIKQTTLLYKRKRESFHSFIKTLDRINLTSISDEELLSQLVRFQSLVLGELYVLNFVQVEHSLSGAVKKVLKESIGDGSEIEDTFVKLIQTEVQTASQKEKNKLLSLATKWNFLKFFNVYSEDKARLDVQRHYEAYKYLYAAYGESPRSLDEFWSEFKSHLQDKKPAFKMKPFPTLLSKEAKGLLRKLNNKKLNILIPLLVQGGIFRDTNKALLGKSMRYRFMVLDEIARRGLEDRDNLNYYLLSDISNLIFNKKTLSAEDINSRKVNGVIFTRTEDFSIYTESSNSKLSQKSNNKNLYGQCASRGSSVGVCKIVLKKEDVSKVEPGDIMVAIGTDFDLIGAMYKSSAVITEEGGVLSHAAVVCRELKKPCCIAVPKATQLLRDGQKIQVDATKGEIVILE